MKTRLSRILAAAALACAASFSVIAQQPAAEAMPSPAAAAASDATEAEVRKVDKSAGKVTLKHGEIKSLDMPAMTMVFAVARPELLDQIKAGDKVRFRAANQDGKYTVTEIQPAP